ncbi:MAG: hypothetical protein PGN07_11310 [Aeromicrobium erythreum]
MRRVVVVSLVSVVVGAVGLLGVQWSGLFDRLDGSAGDNSSPAIDRATPGRYSLVLEQVCVRGTQKATITAVRPVKATDGVRIVDFAVAPPGTGNPRSRQPLQQFVDALPFGTTAPLTRTVENRCADGNPLFSSRQVAVEVRVTDLPAVIAGVEVDYTIRGIKRTATFDNGATFCRGDETPADDERLATDLGLEDLSWSCSQ